jgi:hypothetical protein
MQNTAKAAMKLMEYNLHAPHRFDKLDKYPRTTSWHFYQAIFSSANQIEKVKKKRIVKVYCGGGAAI